MAAASEEIAEDAVPTLIMLPAEDAMGVCEPGRRVPLMSGQAPDRTAGRVIVDVWSDVMCPFCYLGDALFAQRCSSSHTATWSISATAASC